MIPTRISPFAIAAWVALTAGATGAFYGQWGLVISMVAVTLALAIFRPDAHP
jgi:hypothetical protein